MTKSTFNLFTFQTQSVKYRKQVDLWKYDQKYVMCTKLLQVLKYSIL